MARLNLCTLLIATLFIGLSENKLSLFKPCKVSDANFKKCLKSTAQSLIPKIVAGIPEWNLKGFDPHTIENIHSVDSPTLQFELKNNVVYGASTIKINDLNVDPKAQKIVLDYTSSGYMVSDYIADGRILIVPVTGSGKANMSLVNASYKMNLDYKTVKGKDGKDHWKITKHQVSATPDKVAYSFTNLFNGNEQLSTFFIQFANNNWQEIFSELGPQVIKVLTDRSVKEIGRIFAAVPVEDLIILS